ncbi:Radical SAM superfamily protein [Peptoclostridium litorale DSM 5388]|uniref:Radical SAM domain-containing protein n=1 Tax=Peptoclostridium litorale DSM 5388 TaxID=1121324 RepID=A0A069RIT3_PEPLI|nr:radical SAM protein [Peptoclostridium litorale]KDR94127.1 radical SAM domain-containing protein [Peptoclostridium litorale DSM 5388]SIN81206.1 Radical SAM superfamily protein [Peptoclostridium litorale DSM 5388]
MHENNTVYYPQDEMTTFLLPVTLGCSYNKCAFCSMYKCDKYGEVPFSDMEMQLLNAYIYTEKVFLTGADPMSIGFDKMKRLLDMIHQYLPYCACVASYASIKNISKYSVEELSVLHDAGLRMLYIGFETGRDDILKLMNKGHTANEAIKQAKKLNEAKLQFNSIVMYGIAGEGESVDNAVATAEMINQFITNRVITMNLTVFDGTELKNMVKRGDFVPPSRKERLVEVITLLENLEPQKATIFDTTHPTNIVKIKGTLPQDRERLINEVTRQISVSRT